MDDDVCCLNNIVTGDAAEARVIIVTSYGEGEECLTMCPAFLRGRRHFHDGPHAHPALGGDRLAPVLAPAGDTDYDAPAEVIVDTRFEPLAKKTCRRNA